MSTKLDVLFARNYVSGDGQKQTHWMNVGAAFPSKDGKGFDVNIYTLPPPTPNVRQDAQGNDVIEMTYRIHLRPPLPKDGEAGAPQGRRQGGGFGGGTRPGTRAAAPSAPQGSSDDDIPF